MQVLAQYSCHSLLGAAGFAAPVFSVDLEAVSVLISSPDLLHTIAPEFHAVSLGL